MPQIPALPTPLQNQVTGVDPQNFLMAAADLHQQGQLSEPVPVGKPLQTAKPTSRRKRLQVIK